MRIIFYLHVMFATLKYNCYFIISIFNYFINWIWKL